MKRSTRTDPRAAFRVIALFSTSMAVACGAKDEPEEQCRAELPAAAVRCDEPSCSATTGTKTFAIADLDAAKSKKWLVVNWVASEVYDNQETNISHTKNVRGALTPSGASHAARRGSHRALDADEATRIERRRARIRAEHLIRSWQRRGPIDPTKLVGTAVRGRASDLLPKGARAQRTGCGITAPSCGETALCVIPKDSASGTCEAVLELRFPTSGSSFDLVNANVKRVGKYGAIVVEDGTSMSDADARELMRRFDERIAPIDHALFGRPVDAKGRDRDGNGVVVFFVTPRLETIHPDLAGVFQPNDLRDPDEVPTSNGADLLYVQPLGPKVGLDSLSGTIAHEYEHLINFYAKAILRGVEDGEEIWLDEGIASFAEDITGYGGDAFENVKVYLERFGETSLTGFGSNYDDAVGADSAERRGMAHLFVRYFFEQKGNASYGMAPDELRDTGGVAAIRSLVESADTGIELFSSKDTGRSFAVWLGDFMTAVAIDGASYPDVSCNAAFTFAAPTDDAYTQGQNGLDLRGEAKGFGGRMIPLNGPGLDMTFETEDVPVWSNGGDLRTIEIPSGTVEISVGGPAEDFVVQMRALPIP